MEKVIFNTAGDGYWSKVAKAVEIVDMRINYVNDEQDFGELCVYFNTDTWNVNTDGLIYTDSQFKINSSILYSFSHPSAKFSAINAFICFSAALYVVNAHIFSNAFSLSPSPRPCTM